MKISIITPTFNAENTLAEALSSAKSRYSVEIEHIVIDAASSDRTLEIAEGFPGVSVVSEPDLGIYDGMNKGGRLATGEWLLFLQSDDWLPEGTLDIYRKTIECNPEAEMLCGHCEAVKESDGSWLHIWSVTDSASKKLTIKNIALGEPMINARLIRRDIFWKLGGFSLSYLLASDRDFLLRAAENKVLQVEVNALTYRYRWHKGSSTMTEGNAMTGQLSSENLAIAINHLLDSKRLADDDRMALRAWHTRLTVQSAMNAVESLDPAFLKSVLDGHKVDPLWSAAFLSEFFRSLPGFLARGCRTRSQLRPCP